MNLSRRSFLKILGSIAVLADERGDGYVVPKPAPNELLAQAMLIFRAVDGRTYMIHAHAALAPGELWSETIEVDRPMLLDRIIFPSAVAEELLLRSISVDSGDSQLVQPVSAVHFNSRIHFEVERLDTRV